MACNTVKSAIEDEALHAVPYGGVSEPERALLRNSAALTAQEEAGLLDALLHQPHRRISTPFRPCCEPARTHGASST